MLQSGLVQSRASCCSLERETRCSPAHPSLPRPGWGSHPSGRSQHLCTGVPHQQIGVRKSPGDSYQVSAKYLLLSSRGLGKPQATGLESRPPAAGRDRAVGRVTSAAASRPGPSPGSSPPTPAAGCGTLPGPWAHPVSLCRRCRCCRCH